MKHIRETFLAAALAATGLAMAVPASAALVRIGVMDPTTNLSFICVDNDACDASNTIDNELVLDSLLANASLGFGSAFNIARLAAQSNFGATGPTVTFTDSGSGNILPVRRYNDPDNQLWSGDNAFDGIVFDLPDDVDVDFVTSQVLFEAASGAPQCGPALGDSQICQARRNSMTSSRPVRVR